MRTPLYSYSKLTLKVRSMIGLSLMLGLLAFPAIGNAQEAQETFADDVTVSEVLLDVLVTDRDGNVIIGLQADDFIVKEGDETVSVEGAAFYSNRRLLDPGSAGDGVDTTPRDRYFILFFHEQQRASADAPILLQRQLKAGKEAQRWVAREKLLDDWVAVVSYDVKLKIQQDFTQNKQQIMAGIADAVSGKDPGANWPSRMPEAGQVSLRSYLPQGKELAQRTERIYDALSVLAEASGKIQARKNLVFFGTGFGDTGAFGLYRPDPRYFDDMAQSLNDNNVAVYALDLVPPEIDYSLSDALNQLSDETGGQYFTYFTSFLSPLQKISSENSGYYLLSYRSRHPQGAEGFQQVKVATRNPEFKVRAREGYLYGQLDVR